LQGAFRETVAVDPYKPLEGKPMSASHEWSEYHLTPEGWKSGSEQQDFAGVQTVPPPSDRVLTCRFHERQSSIYSSLDRWVDEVWRSEDAEAIEELLKKYGPCPEHL
jgi:hypothetical protein